VGHKAPTVLQIWEPHRRSLLLLRWCPFCGTVGSTLMLVVVLESHPGRLPPISVFDRIKGDGILEIISASVYGVTDVTVKNHRRPFPKAKDGLVSLAAFIPEVHRLIFECRFRMHSSDGQSLPIATMLLSSDEHR
jgi:hypothetical protein